MEPLRLYNTLTRKVEDFTPLHGTNVGMYTCGPTVYSTPHIGNFRSYIFADILRRTLSMDGFDVKQVINITDVGHLTSDADEGEDKLEKGARTEGQTVWDVAATHTKEFQDGCTELNIVRPDVWAKATDHIDDQIVLIEKLVKKGHTYETPQAVYFDITTFSTYGDLSGQRLADKKTGARSDVVTDTDKKHPADFALWFKRTGKFAHHTMYWPSPWGDGFPGWHIECSAMSMKYLGEQFDIHTGGIDHIPVHHENEIAQSEGATGKHPFVKYWMHNEFLTLPGKRMGKSEGNSVTIQDIIDHGIHPLAFRYLCLQTHYRKPMSFTWDALESAQQRLYRLWTRISLLGDQPSSNDGQPSLVDSNGFIKALSNDLGTPQALAWLEETITSHDLTAQDIAATMKVCDSVLALDLTYDAACRHIVPDSPELQALLKNYVLARKERRYDDSDRIRTEFESLGTMVEDLPDGTSRLRKKGV